MSAGCCEDEDSDTEKSRSVVVHYETIAVDRTYIEKGWPLADTTSTLYSSNNNAISINKSPFTANIHIFPIDNYASTWGSLIAHTVCHHGAETHLQSRRIWRLVPRCRTASCLDQRPEWNDAGDVSVFAEEAGSHATKRRRNGAGYMKGLFYA